MTLKGDLKDLPMGIVVRMWEETKKQYKSYTIEKFLKDTAKTHLAGFSWNETEAGSVFWYSVLVENDFDLFFEKYQEYERYNLD